MYNTISQDFINETLDTSRATAQSTGPRETAPKGGYKMKVKGIYPRQIKSGSPAARVLLVHAEGDYANTYLDLYKSKDNAEENSVVTNRALVVIGDAAGISGEALQSLDFSVTGDSAAITVAGNELALAGKGIEDIWVYASLDVESYTGKDGETKTKNVVKSIRKFVS